MALAILFFVSPIGYFDKTSLMLRLNQFTPTHGERLKNTVSSQNGQAIDFVSLPLCRILTDELGL